MLGMNRLGIPLKETIRDYRGVVSIFSHSPIEFVRKEG